MLPYPATSNPPSPVPSMGEWDAEVQADLDDATSHPHHPHHNRQSLTATTSQTLKRIINSTTGASSSHSLSASTAIDGVGSINSLHLTNGNNGIMTSSTDFEAASGSTSLSTSPSKLPPGLKKLRKRTSQSTLGVAAKRIMYEPRAAMRQLRHDNVLKQRLKWLIMLLLTFWTVLHWFGLSIGDVVRGTTSRTSASYFAAAKHGGAYDDDGQGGHASYNTRSRKRLNVVPKHQKLRWGAEQTVSNWGDHVGLGRARQDVLDRTPRPYIDIGDHWIGSSQPNKRTGGAHLYFKRRTLQQIRSGEPVQHHHEPGEEDGNENNGDNDGNKRNWDFERDRHGVMGGASVEWSKGVVGSGKYLGEIVDMRKDGSYDPREEDEEEQEDDLSKLASRQERGHTGNDEAADEDEDDEEDEEDEDGVEHTRRDEVDDNKHKFVQPRDPQIMFDSASTRQLVHKAERRALVDHILEQGWLYLDEDDKTNTEKLLSQAKKEGFMDSLPLRDRVRGDEELMEEAAIGWARIYTAQKGEWQKSALEVALEKMARRVPIIVFSKTTCPHSTRAKELLKMYRLSPAPQIVEVDMRPDQKALVGLLARRTNHATFPNIIIGSRSIGGADDLEALAKSGELATLFDEVRVRHGKWKFGGDHNDD
ncbi:hypothetical protein OIO90_003959 [Microbotryomycetes sp. JL221]|nr:hypothetical protein OIO90_003959 [Microbotryomycetes sp. JL221]